MKIEGIGLPPDVEIISVNRESGEVTLNKSVTISADILITPVKSTNKVETLVPVVDQKSVELKNTEGLKPGMKVQGAGLPDGLEIVSVDPVTNVVIFNKPITVEAGVEIRPTYEFEPALSTPTISFSRLTPEEIGGIAKNLSSGTSVPSKLTDDIQNIADNTPPAKPDDDKDAPPPTPPSAEPPAKEVKDDVNKTIQDVIERENQKNPSPTGG